MHVVLPFCGRDIHLALKGLAICKKLDGRQSKHSLILVWDQRVDPEPVKKAAAEAFERVMLWPTQLSPYGFEGFAPANWAWQCTARRAIQNAIGPWLWWEPDAVPLKTGWLDQLEAAYREAGKPLGGWVQDSKWGRYMVGVGIYPQDIIARAGTARMCSSSPWDIQLGAIDGFARQTADLGRLLVHHYRAAGDGDHFDSLEDVSALANGAVLFHRCDDGSLHRLVLGEGGEWPRPWFLHSGDLGDIIYALPTIKALGGGTLILAPHKSIPPFGCREEMTKSRFNLIAPLLQKQPYIKHLQWCAEQPKVDHNLNQFRLKLWGEEFDRNRHRTLSSLVLETFNLPVELENEKWLEVDAITPPKPVVVGRSPRYHGNLNWQHIARTYKDQMVFVGTAPEHAKFCEEVSEVPWKRTNNMLEVAQLIAGSQLFVGNQSSPYAIAEGLKHPAILEWYPKTSNCRFVRPNCLYGPTADTQLPKIVNQVEVAKPKITWCALWDGNSGLGRVVQSFLSHSKFADYQVLPTRSSLVENAKLVDDIPTISKRDDRPAIVMDAIDYIGPFVRDGDVIITMWEAPRIPQKFVKILNMARAVIVPSDWCASVFSASGVNSSLHIIPLGIDPTIYKPAKRKSDGIFRFGMATRFWKHGHPRKQLEIVIESFLEAFPSEQFVRLDVKGYDEGVPVVSDPRVNVISEFWQETKLVEWYQGLDCFINLASGGGWELHLQEAMACGAVPMSTHHSGSTMFFNQNNGIEVDFRLGVPLRGPWENAGVWAVPDKQSVIDQMRWAVRHQSTLSKKSKLSVESAHGFTWEGAAKKLDRVLAEYL